MGNRVAQAAAKALIAIVASGFALHYALKLLFVVIDSTRTLNSYLS